MDKYRIPGVKTFEFTKIIGLENIAFGRPVIIDDFVLIYAKNKIRIGNYVHISSFCSISGGGRLTMADFSGLASGVRLILGTDDFKDWGFGNPTVPEKYRHVKRGDIHLGRFAIIGANAVILPGVRIEEGAAVAAGSVVTKSLPAWGIYAGNRRIGARNREAIMANFDTFRREEHYEE